MDFEDRSGTAPDLLAMLRLKLEHDIPLTTEEAAVVRGCAPETLNSRAGARRRHGALRAHRSCDPLPGAELRGVAA